MIKHSHPVCHVEQSERSHSLSRKEKVSSWKSKHVVCHVERSETSHKEAQKILM